VKVCGENVRHQNFDATFSEAENKQENLNVRFNKFYRTVRKTCLVEPIIVGIVNISLFN